MNENRRAPLNHDKHEMKPNHFREVRRMVISIEMDADPKEILAIAGDYDPSWPETTKSFSVQNKPHFAATGMTAAELIKSRVDHSLPNMGLTNWKAIEVRRTDVTIAKNYLKEDEIDELNRVVVVWPDFAEDQAKRHRQYMDAIGREDTIRELEEAAKRLPMGEKHE